MDVYRVLVVRESSGSCVGSEVLFEAASPDAGRLLGYALDEVETALTEIVDTLAEIGQLKATGAISEPRDATPAEQGAAAPTKRRRRTKAEIAEDKAREAAEAALATGGTVPAEAPPIAVGEPEPVPAPAAVAEPAPAQQPATVPATVPAAAPYNPFA